MILLASAPLRPGQICVMSAADVRNPNFGRIYAAERHIHAISVLLTFSGEFDPDLDPSGGILGFRVPFIQGFEGWVKD